MGRLLCLVLLAGLFLAACSPANYPKKFKLPAALPEVSGLVVAGPDSLWWLNDGGSGADLYLTDRRGNLLRTLRVGGAVNRDWEGMTTDHQGNLYVGDFGNNRNARRDLCIYRFDMDTEQLDSITFTYPDQTAFPPPSERANFDMEAIFWHADSLHLFSKNRLWDGNYYTKHYVLPAVPGDYSAILRDSIFLKNRVVTGAAMSPAYDRAALVAYYFKPLLGFIPIVRTSIFFFEDFPDQHYFRGRMTKKKVAKGLAPTQYECIDFESPERVLIASEKTIMRQQKAKRIKLKRKNGA